MNATKAAERETIIRWDMVDHVASIYTAEPAMRRK